MIDDVHFECSVLLGSVVCRDSDRRGLGAWGPGQRWGGWGNLGGLVGGHNGASKGSGFRLSGSVPVPGFSWLSNMVQNL